MKYFLIQESTPDILSGDELREFWVRWSAGLVEVGEGGIPGQSRLIILDDSAAPLDINALTVGAGFEAEWFFPGVIGNVYDSVGAD